MSQIPRNLAFPLLGIVFVHGGGCHIVRDFAAPKLLLDGASREGMMKQPVFDPETREGAIVKPSELTRCCERSARLLLREARLGKSIPRLALAERAAEGLSERR